MLKLTMYFEIPFGYEDVGENIYTEKKDGLTRSENPIHLDCGGSIRYARKTILYCSKCGKRVRERPNGNWKSESA